MSFVQCLGIPSRSKPIWSGRFPSQMARFWRSSPGSMLNSSEFEAASIPGAATTVQFMVKDFKKVPDHGRLGFREIHRRQACR